jgi:hypothetical protein
MQARLIGGPADGMLCEQHIFPSGTFLAGMPHAVLELSP